MNTARLLTPDGTVDPCTVVPIGLDSPLRARHVMVEIAPTHRALVAEAIGGGVLPMHDRAEVVAEARRLFETHAIPGIVCAPKAALPEGWLQLGVSFPFRDGGVRVRSAVAVPAAGVGRAFTPWQIAEAVRPGAFPEAAMLADLVATGRSVGAAVGFFGSAALTALTGLAYMEAQSDVDVVAAARSGADLGRFAAAMAEFARTHGRRIDVEVATPAGLGVKLEELLSNVTAVVGRGIDGVRLVERRRVLREIDTLPPAVPVP